MSEPIFSLSLPENDPTKQALERAMQSVIDAFYEELGGIVTGLLPVGTFDPGNGRFPAEAIHGTYYFVSAPGILDGQTFAVGDWLVPLHDDASTSRFAGHWTRGDYSKVVRTVYDSPAHLQTSQEMPRGVNAAWQTKDGFSYIEADPHAEDHHLVTSSGVKLKLADIRVIDVRAFNPPTDGVTDASRALQAALDTWKAEITGDVPDARHCILRVVGRYTVSKQLLVQFDDVQTGKGVIDMTGGQITSALEGGSLFRVRTNATTRNLHLRNFYLRRGGSGVDVLLEMDGGHQANGSLARWNIENPTLVGSKVPLWFRNNCFEGVVINPNIVATSQKKGCAGIRLDDNFDAPTPHGINFRSMRGKVSSISIYGGTIKNGWNNLRVNDPIDVRAFGTTFLNSGGAMFHNASNVSGGLFACHFENAWDSYEGNKTVRPVIRMDSNLTVENCDYRQSVGKATCLVQTFVSMNVNAQLGPNRILTPDVDHLYVTNRIDNGARIYLPAAARGKIGYADSTIGPRLVCLPQPSFWNAPPLPIGDTSLEIDLMRGNIWFATATGTLTISTARNAHPGDELTLIIEQDGRGGRELVWSPAFRPATAPGTSPNTRTSWKFIYDGATWIESGSSRTS
ncbi:hypothetical protein SAMN04488105_12516 [Salipiger thiooxidans]|uniref:Pectate lyase superfamily protein n=1 Tax=Salipiger thiooxidans TaxID=282683 RepID=A0A1G7LMC8_9RHOB|nr:hypothetical protein [Salipiger thiooxidans]SDF50561.1 hypothetical protein SAMN04488105_12516 [Salipiger thiooxidans]